MLLDDVRYPPPKQKRFERAVGPTSMSCKSCGRIQPQHNKTVLATIGMVSVALVLGVLGTSWQAIRASRSAAAERTARHSEATQLAIAKTERARARAHLELAE